MNDMPAGQRILVLSVGARDSDSFWVIACLDPLFVNWCSFATLFQLTKWQQHPSNVPALRLIVGRHSFRWPLLVFNWILTRLVSRMAGAAFLCVGLRLLASVSAPKLVSSACRFIGCVTWAVCWWISCLVCE